MVEADWAVLDPLYRYGAAHPGWVTAWDVLCTVFHPAVFRLLALIWIVYALMRRDYRVALFLGLTVEFSALIVVFMKAIVSRPRPATALVSELSSSFPSGHALGASVGRDGTYWSRPGLCCAIIGATTAVLAGVLIVGGGRHRAGGAQCAPSLRCAGRLGARLSVGGRVPAGADQQPVHGSGRNTGSDRYRLLKVASWHDDFHLTVVGDRGGSVHRGEAELGHP